MISRILVVLLVAVAFSARAEDAKAKAAREELERQLSQMVGKQPTKVRIDYVSIDDPNYALEEASFEIDGRIVGAPSLRELSDEGTHLVWNGDVTPGKHVVKVRLVFANGASVVISDEGGYKWKVGGEVGFDVNSGIEVRVQVTPKRDSKQTDIAKRFKLSLPAQPVMIAQLDDGKMPEAPPRPVIDAGPSPEVVAAAEKAKAAEEAKRLAAEEKQRKADEALAAKQAAAEEKKARAAAALEAQKAAAEEKKAKAAAALEAKRLAAEEKKAAALEAKRLAAEEKQAALEAKRLADAEKKRLAAMTPAERAEEEKRKEEAKVLAAAPVIDAGTVVAEVDAGVAPTAVAEVVDAGAPVVAPPAVVKDAEESGPPWLLIGGAGALAAVVFLVLVARRRSRPPTLDD